MTTPCRSDPKRCARCGSKLRLQWHHMDPSTKCFNIGGPLYRTTPEEIQAEKDKCIRLCRYCHQVIHVDYDLQPAHDDLPLYCRLFVQTQHDVIYTFADTCGHRRDLVASSLIHLTLPDHLTFVSAGPHPFHRKLPKASRFGGRRFPVDHA